MPIRRRCSSGRGPDSYRNSKHNSSVQTHQNPPSSQLGRLSGQLLQSRAFLRESSSTVFRQPTNPDTISETALIPALHTRRQLIFCNNAFLLSALAFMAARGQCAAPEGQGLWGCGSPGLWRRWIPESPTPTHHPRTFHPSLRESQYAFRYLCSI